MSVRILRGDVREMLATLPDESVHCCVTSPPYYGLRDYGVPGQLGLEPTLAEYLDNMVAVFREVRRVLRSDGTLWLNIGDSYAGSWGAQGRQGETGQMAGRSVAGARVKSEISRAQIAAHPHRVSTPCSIRDEGMKPKDLMMVPARLALALQADGWWLRQDIIWHKPNPMPESVTDRCTKSHEYLFLMAKSERYFYDADAVMEPVAASTVERLSQPTLTRQLGSDRVPGKTNGNMKAVGTAEKRNRRSVWTVPTMPFKEAHFATFPQELIKPCILAGCPAGGTVLDPFFGSGTTGLVAGHLQRDCIGIELNPAYADMAERRIRGDAPLFAEVV